MIEESTLMRIVWLIAILASSAACERRNTDASHQTTASVANGIPAAADSAVVATADSQDIVTQSAEYRGLASKDELVGGVGLNMDETDVLAVLGEPLKRSAAFWEGLGDTVRTWDYSSVSVDFRGSSGVGGIRCISAPCETSRGVGIGTDIHTLNAAYRSNFFYADDSTRVAGFEPRNGCALQIRLRVQRVVGIEISCEL